MEAGRARQVAPADGSAHSGRATEALAGAGPGAAGPSGAAQAPGVLWQSDSVRPLVDQLHANKEDERPMASSTGGPENGPEAAASASGDEPEPPAKTPRWYTPLRLLMLFCAIMFLAYLDLGLFASNGVTGAPRPYSLRRCPGLGVSDSSCPKSTQYTRGIQPEFDLSNMELGLLPAMFTAGLMLSCVLVAELAAHMRAFRLIGWGMAMWVLGAIFTAVSQNYGSLMFARIFIGFGEASIMTLSGPFIDDVAPPTRKATWFAWLMLFPSLGTAAGYVGGTVAEAIGWRYVFYIEAALAAPIVAFFLLAPPIALRSSGPELIQLAHGSSAETGKAARWRRFAAAARQLWGHLAALHRHPVWVANNWGFVPVQALLGVFTFWGPKAALQILGKECGGSDAVDLTLGVITFAAGIVGTLGGGILLDRVGSALRNAMLLQAVGAASSLVILIVAFWATSTTVAFYLLLSVGLLGLFVVQAPVTAVSMWAVPLGVRPASQAVQVVCMHLFGDVPSPPIVGHIQDKVENWRVTMTAACAILAISVALYSFGFCAAFRAPDYRPERAPPLEDVEDVETQQAPGQAMHSSHTYARDVEMS